MVFDPSNYKKKAHSTWKNPKENAHILVVRFSAMGDVAMLVPVLRVITKTYPRLQVTVLTRIFFTPLFNDIPNVKVYPADLKGLHNGVAGLSRLARELRNLEIDAVADVHNVLRSNVLNSIFYFYGIPVKQIDKGRTEKKELTRGDQKVFKQLTSTQQRYANVFGALGYPVEINNPQFPTSKILSSQTIKITGKPTQQWLGIAPFAQHPSKVYPMDLMEEVIYELDKDAQYEIFLFGGGDREVKELELLSSKYKNVINLAGKLSFLEELNVISNLNVMLSMDSGNAHLAAMSGIPVITLWGVTHPYAGFSAYNQPLENHLLPDLNKFPKIPTSIYGNKVPAGYEDVMRTISPKDIVQKIQKMIGSNI